MLLQIPDVFTPEQVAQARQLLATAHWVDGRVTAGHQSARTKDNTQLPEDHPVARRIGEMILSSLQGNPPVHLGRRRCFRRSSTATKAGSRSATTWTTPFAK